MIQDIFPHIFHNEFRPDAKPGEHSPVLCFDGQKVLVRSFDASAETLRFPELKELESLNPDLVYAFAVDEMEFFLDKSVQRYKLEGFVYEDIRMLRTSMENVYGMITFTGYHLFCWYADNAYCGRCGSPASHAKTERAMHCDKCGRNIYPRIMPAVIVGVIDNDRLLLTKYSTGFKYYALVAGFTEIGETLEETVKREVYEETGLHVKNVRYYKSQPWGIANDILVGYYCDVDGSSEIRLDEKELKLAEWKSRDEIELHPDSFSLTNEMMRMFKEYRI